MYILLLLCRNKYNFIFNYFIKLKAENQVSIKHISFFKQICTVKQLKSVLELSNIQF